MANAYFNAVGKLLYITAGQTENSPPDGAGYVVVGLPDDTDPNGIYYDLDTDGVAEKLPLSLMISFNNISNIPVGSVVNTNQGVFVVGDGSMEFENNVSETVRVYVEHLHHISEFVEVETGPVAP